MGRGAPGSTGEGSKVRDGMDGNALSQRGITRCKIGAPCRTGNQPWEEPRRHGGNNGPTPVGSRVNLHRLGGVRIPLEAVNPTIAAPRRLSEQNYLQKRWRWSAERGAPGSAGVGGKVTDGMDGNAPSRRGIIRRVQKA